MGCKYLAGNNLPLIKLINDDVPRQVFTSYDCLLISAAFIVPSRVGLLLGNLCEYCVTLRGAGHVIYSDHNCYEKIKTFSFWNLIQVVFVVLTWSRSKKVPQASAI